MRRFPIFPVALGLVALLATAILLVLEFVLASGTWSSTPAARVLAVIAIIAEAFVLVLLLTKITNYVRGSNGRRSGDLWSAWFASDLVVSTLASVASVALLIVVGKASDLPKDIANVHPINLVIGSALALGFACLCQLFFAVAYYVLYRLPNSGKAHSLHTNEEGRLSPQITMRVKSVPYERTKPALSQTSISKRDSSDFASRPGTSSGRSAAESVSSFAGSVSSVVRPMGSKTRLLSGRRVSSLDSNSYRDRMSGTSQDGFDSWDTSSVDPRHRQLVLKTTLPIASRFLETIPASPTTSRSPSPGCPLDLEPPKRGRQRGRSYSPAPATRTQRARTVTPPESELNIHPLFRSDSPGPLPAATPGTVVIAAPQAGRLMAKSVVRMRSSSSPLNRQGSDESMQTTSSLNSDSLRREDGGSEARKMTPPIPDWILNIGSKTNLGENPNSVNHG
ncbi:hypothetical protein F4808DRAFT_464364 [Astrocystis sublimbata]|nr:hypothetical protein F4808DRAFT_464364 [Astrocystis sublimbata]